jgi:hypothetical protein
MEARILSVDAGEGATKVTCTFNADNEGYEEQAVRIADAGEIYMGDQKISTSPNSYMERLCMQACMEVHGTGPTIAYFVPSTHCRAIKCGSHVCLSSSNSSADVIVPHYGMQLLHNKCICEQE